MPHLRYPPAFTSPPHTPQHTHTHTLAQAQLAALQAEDPEAVWAFASPDNRAVTGPLTRFASMLQVLHAAMAGGYGWVGGWFAGWVGG